MTHHTILNCVSGVYVCGNNNYGQLGLGDYQPRNILTKLPSFHSEKEEVLAIYSREHHLILKTNDSVYVCGNNNHGQRAIQALLTI